MGKSANRAATENVSVRVEWNGWCVFVRTVAQPILCHRRGRDSQPPRCTMFHEDVDTEQENTNNAIKVR